jgi:hypothetical protein
MVNPEAMNSTQLQASSSRAGRHSFRHTSTCIAIAFQGMHQSSYLGPPRTWWLDVVHSSLVRCLGRVSIQWQA